MSSQAGIGAVEGALSLDRLKKLKENAVDYTKCIICQGSEKKGLLAVQTTNTPKLVTAMAARKDEVYGRLHIY